MIVTITNIVEGYRVTGYYGIVFGEVITGINFLRDFGELEQRASALGAHAVVGVDMDYEVLGQGNMLMVTASGTAVTVEPA